MNQKFRGELQRSVTRRDGRCSGVAPRELLARNCAAAMYCHCETASPKATTDARPCVYVQIAGTILARLCNMYVSKHSLHHDICSPH